MMDLSQSTAVLCFGRIINVDLYYYSAEEKQSKAVSINTPKTGLKPDITVNLSIIPSNNVMAVTVTIRNMIIDFDISRAFYMDIAMGYETCGVALYKCVVFRSYQVSPNPDGVYVFEGVVTGDVVENSDDVSVVEDDPYSLIFNQEGTENLHNFIAFTLNGQADKKAAGNKVKLPKFQFDIQYTSKTLENEIKSAEINVNKNSKTFRTPLSRAAYAKQVLLGWAAENDKDIAVVLEGNKFIINTMADDDSVVPSSAIDIIGYTSATYNGAFLNIVMPYYPAINASSLIRCDAGYATQGYLPNSVNWNTNIRNSAYSLYRVFRYNVTFSTVHENTMSIDAMPVKRAGRVEVGNDNTEADRGARRNQGMSYLQDILKQEYEGDRSQVELGTIASQDLVVKAMKNDAGKVFAKSTSKEDYNDITDGDIIKFISNYDNYAVYKLTTIPKDNSGYYPIDFTPDMLFPLVFVATWNSAEDSSNISQSVPYYPIYFTSGKICMPNISSMVNAGNWSSVVSVLNDFIKIYEKDDAYVKYVSLWNKLIEQAKGIKIK